MRSSVDRIHDHEELVVKPAAPAVMATGLYAGTTLADDGSPILLFDPAGLAEVGGVKLEVAGARRADRRGPVASDRVASDAGAAVPRPRRRPPRASPGGRRPDRGSSGQRSPARRRASFGSSSARPSCRSPARRRADLGDEKVRLFRLNDGAHEIGYAFAEVIDFAAIDNDIIHADRPGEISGVSLIDGEPAELVDAHWLFANHVGAAARTRASSSVCRLPGDDPWMQNMLRPIVEAAGYRVVGDGDEADADLVIAVAAATKLPTTRRDETIWLRTEPEAAGKKDESIYRYDRAGLADGAEVGRRGEGQMNELLLVVTIAGERVALPAAAVESVVELDTLIPVPRAAPHVAGLSALRSRVLTVIDCMRSLELGDDRLLGRHSRSRGRRARRPSLRADRRSRRRRGRSPVRAGAGARRDGRRAGSACRRAWSRPRPDRCCWSTSQR